MVMSILSKADAFEYTDQVLERWYPSVEEGNDKGIVVLVTSQKEGQPQVALLLCRLLEILFLMPLCQRTFQIIGFIIAILATKEKYNEAIYTSAKRPVAAVDGLPDPGGPSFKDNKRESNFKTKEETEEKRGQFTLVVGGLLVIAFAVPMAQYYAYVSRK